MLMGQVYKKIGLPSCFLKTPLRNPMPVLLPELFLEGPSKLSFRAGCSGVAIFSCPSCPVVPGSTCPND